MKPSCPECKIISYLPPPSPEELAEQLQYPEEVPEEVPEDLTHYIGEPLEAILQRWQRRLEEEPLEIENHRRWEEMVEEEERRAIERRRSAASEAASEAARAENIMSRRFAYVLGVCGVAFYNLEYLMEMVMEVAMEVDPTMGGLEMTVNIVVMILMFILMSLGIAEQLEQLVNWRGDLGG